MKYLIAVTKTAFAPRSTKCSVRQDILTSDRVSDGVLLGQDCLTARGPVIDEDGTNRNDD